MNQPMDSVDIFQYLNPILKDRMSIKISGVDRYENGYKPYN